MQTPSSFSPDPTTQSILPGTSLLVATRNRPKFIIDLIESIYQCPVLPNEIVIVDQSDEQNPEIVNFSSRNECELRYLWTDKIGVSRARNTAIKEARYEILVFTDDDTLATPGWFCELVQALNQAGQRSVITGRVEPYNPDMDETLAPSTKSTLEKIVYKGRCGKDVLYTNNMVVYKTAFTEIGFFDERLGPGTPFPAAEDNDIGFRLLEANYEIIYEPKAVIFHRAWRSSREMTKLQWNYGYGQGAFYAKHINFHDRFMFMRLVKDLFKYTAYLPIKIWRSRYQALNNIVFACALVAGALQWTNTYKLTRS
jgi:GT2 family glycosyltransferase